MISKTFEWETIKFKELKKLTCQSAGSNMQSNPRASKEHNFWVVTWLFFILIDVLPLGCTALHVKNGPALFPLVWRTRQWHSAEQSPVWAVCAEPTLVQKPYSNNKGTEMVLFYVWICDPCSIRGKKSDVSPE